MAPGRGEQATGNRQQATGKAGPLRSPSAVRRGEGQGEGSPVGVGVGVAVDDSGARTSTTIHTDAEVGPLTPSLSPRGRGEREKRRKKFDVGWGR
jgi:hypothetical protein